jgi:hypothetical protein
MNFVKNFVVAVGLFIGIFQILRMLKVICTFLQKSILRPWILRLSIRLKTAWILLCMLLRTSLLQKP